VRQKPFLHTDDEHGGPLLSLRIVNGGQGDGGFDGARRDVAFSQVKVREQVAISGASDSRASTRRCSRFMSRSLACSCARSQSA
jgi:hypothetical protein